ncbi:MAG: Rieske 2Fe-2S domain-containing protein [Candidatus Promineifilaceae bacterium]|nr:Rieske 2Fe-2S domain-containing protein [Candidatus Promineifilaceae bacterium]
MLSRRVNELLGQLPQLQEWGKEIASAVHQLVLDGGPPARNVADLLHGTWLGHPLHPVLTDLVVGAWTLAAFFDLASLVEDEGQATMEKTADMLTTLGNAAAIPTAISGMADFSTIPNPAAADALVHSLLNSTGLALYLGSAEARRQGNRDSALALSTAGLAVLFAGAWMGGHLVYNKKVGVNHADIPAKPTEWTPVLEAEALQAGEPVRVTAEENPVLLYRQGEQIYAIGAVCPHAGAPLENGEFDGHHVQCPWHDSVFDLRDGCVVHGPSTFPTPNYEARIRGGQVEVRIAD